MWPNLDVGVQLPLLPLAVLTQGPFRSALSMGCRSAALRTGSYERELVEKDLRAVSLDATLVLRGAPARDAARSG